MNRKLFEPLVKPVNRNILKKELTPGRFLRPTRMGKNNVYVFDGVEAPNLMKEVGRLRELTFRDAGAGIGAALDLDQHDTGEHKCRQLIVWDPAEEEIVGGYRFNTFEQYQNQLNAVVPLINKELYDMSPAFENNFSPYFIELTRAFIQPKYQTKHKDHKVFFALDNVWDGLGALLVQHPQCRHFFGRLVIYPSYDPFMRDLLFYFFKKHLYDKDETLCAKFPYEPATIKDELHSYLKTNNANKDFMELHKIARARNTVVPALISAYYRISDTMRVFEPVVDHHFGGCFATAMMITIADIKPNLIDRYVNPYKKFVKDKNTNKIFQFSSC